MTAQTICTQRGFHRFVTVSPDGTDIEEFDDCVDCGSPRALPTILRGEPDWPERVLDAVAAGRPFQVVCT